MLERNIALNAIPNTIVAAFAQRKLCDSNSDRSIAGADVRAWWATNTQSTAMPPRIDATVAPDVHPQSSPRTSPSVSSTEPATRSPTPSGAGSLLSGSRDSRSDRRPMTIVATPTGRLITNTQRQPPHSTSAAPSVGPTAPASAAVAPQIAAEIGIRSRGVDRRMSASDDGTSAAPPTACTARAATSITGFGATAHSNDAAVNNATPARNICL